MTGFDLQVGLGHLFSRVVGRRGELGLALVVLVLSACAGPGDEPTLGLSTVTSAPLASVETETPAATPTEVATMIAEETATTMPEETATVAPAEAEVEDTITPLQAELGLPAGTAIALQQTGGFAGVDNLWIFYGDGTIVTPSGEALYVAAKDVGDQLAALDAAGFFEMAQPKPKAICCDHFSYTLYARDGDRENVITLSGGDPDLPPELMDNILNLQNLAAEAAGS